MIDTYRHKGLRKILVEEIRNMGINDEKVLEALNVIPRHFFLNTTFVKQAYENIAFQIGAGQTISQPYTVAIQSELLQLKKGMKVLEIGTGSGYQTAVLCEMGAKVFSIERQRELYVKAQPLLKSLGYAPKLKYGDGYLGWPAFAPFDRVIVTCGAPDIPEDLVDQLANGGRMIVPVGRDGNQQMTLVSKGDDGQISEEVHGEFRFVPMLKSKNS